MSSSRPTGCFMGRPASQAASTRRSGSSQSVVNRDHSSTRTRTWLVWTGRQIQELAPARISPGFQQHVWIREKQAARPVRLVSTLPPYLLVLTRTAKTRSFLPFQPQQVEKECWPTGGALCTDWFPAPSGHARVQAKKSTDRKARSWLAHNVSGC